MAKSVPTRVTRQKALSSPRPWAEEHLAGVAGSRDREGVGHPVACD